MTLAIDTTRMIIFQEKRETVFLKCGPITKYLKLYSILHLE